MTNFEDSYKASMDKIDANSKAHGINQPKHVYTDSDGVTKITIGEKTRRLADIDTGEVVDVTQVTKVVHGTKQFWKLYLTDFMKVLDIMESKQLDVLIHILENTDDKSNLYIGTYKQISKRCNVSEPTIATVMRKLQKAGFIARKQNGVYRISAKFLHKGNERKQAILLSYFNSEQENNNFHEEHEEKK